LAFVALPDRPAVVQDAHPGAAEIVLARLDGTAAVWDPGPSTCEKPVRSSEKGSLYEDFLFFTIFEDF
jgi:hypothetical protein